jgi:arylsulfatase A-like enzyme
LTTSRGRLAVLLVAVLLASCGRSAEDAELRFPKAPVLMISIDTLRADRLGCYGYERGTSPVLDALADESVLFEEVYAPSCKTAESHMSLFTSLPVTVHGVSNASARLDLPLRQVARNRLTLGQVLRRAGYWNAAVACGGNVIPEMGFSRGFAGRFESMLRDVSEIVDGSLAVLDVALAQDEPPFLFVHTYQVHGPYIPPAAERRRFAPEYRGIVGERVRAIENLPFQAQWAAMNQSFWVGVEAFGPEDAAYLSDLYDGEVAYTDRELGRLLEGLAARDLLDEMIVIVLSDHGEEFAEHGHYEHDQLYRESLHVPLLIRLPGARLGGTRVSGLASLIDVMPTLLDLLGVEGPEGMVGRSLVPAMERGRTEGLPVLSERVMFADAYMASLRTPASTTVFLARESALEHYDLRRDPGETQDLAGAAPFAAEAEQALYGQLAAVFSLRTALDAEEEGGLITLDEETRQQLLELNYVGGDEAPPIPEGTPLDRWPGR